MSLTSPLLTAIPGIQYGFGTARHLVPSALSPYWHRVPEKTQVHGTQIVEITSEQQMCGGADGFYTRQPGIPVTVITADCVPVLFARRDGKAIAAVHAGWRGLRYGVIGALWQRLRAEGEDPADWVAAIGSHINACCFEVSAELAQEFVSAFADHPAELITPSYRHLDLNAIAVIELQKAGLQHIDKGHSCTLCSSHTDGKFLYRSYRRGDRNSHQHSGLVILP
ncbi:peptidoglycan editing factor PgeF [Undibacterium aquatile]|uniref:Purine nucleoside phosphorylase n=1 Tax=Undibacterium aquatile TaxID=1537398 RepID=A0ABR6XGA9_9BURK|nr:peptidoglycan editing factor PgeF [Undibacterium aquatile]MBC3811800.1 peptidoglycan editing factor PgeF [Undibacterium aquatile]